MAWVSELCGGRLLGSGSNVEKWAWVRDGRMPPPVVVQVSLAVEKKQEKGEGRREKLLRCRDWSFDGVEKI